MTLRLVLVSLVAALGLTIPGAPMIESWVASTQNWMNARFADWDTRNPQDADYVIVSDYYDGGQFASRPAISYVPVATSAHRHSHRAERPEAGSAATTLALSTTPAPLPDARTAVVRSVSFVRKAPVFEPIEVPERIKLSPVEQLNRMNEGIGIVPPRVLETSTPRPRFEPITLAEHLYQGIGFELNHLNEGMSMVPARLVRWVASRRTVQPIRVFEDLYGGSAPRQNRKIEVIAIKPATPVPPVVPPAKAPVMTFGPMETCPSLYFAGELNQPAPKPAATVSIPGGQACSSGPKPAPLPRKWPRSRPRFPRHGQRPSRRLPESESTDDPDLEVASINPLDDGFGVFASHPGPRTSASRRSRLVSSRSWWARISAPASPTS